MSSQRKFFVIMSLLIIISFCFLASPCTVISKSFIAPNFQGIPFDNPHFPFQDNFFPPTQNPLLNWPFQPGFSFPGRGPISNWANHPIFAPQSGMDLPAFLAGVISSAIDPLSRARALDPVIDMSTISNSLPSVDFYLSLPLSAEETISPATNTSETSNSMQLQSETITAKTEPESTQSIPKMQLQQQERISPQEMISRVNLKNALNIAGGAGPRGPVRLEEGTFYISRPIQAADFDGTFTDTGEPDVIVEHDEDDLFDAGIEKVTAGKTFTVAPTGVDDTENIQNALNMAVAAGPGSKVQLTDGMFYLSRPIQVEDFDGTFTGTGNPQVDVVHDENGRIESVTYQRGTVIQTLGTELEPFPPTVPPLNVSNVVFAFYNREKGVSAEEAPDIKIQNMAVVHSAPTTPMRILDADGNEMGVGKQMIVFWVSGRYTLAEPVVPPERPFPLIADGYGWHAGNTCYCNVTFDRVKVTGQMEFGDFSTVSFLYQAWLTDYKMDPGNDTIMPAISYDCFWQRMTGKMAVKDCGMNGFGAPSGICAWEVEDSQIEVKDCVAENSYMPAFFTGGNVEGSTNCMMKVSGLIAQGPAATFIRPSDCEIEVKDCVAENSPVWGFAVVFSVPSNCKIKVADCEVKSNLDLPAVYSEFPSNCDLKVSHLTTHGCSGVQFGGGYGTSNYEFRDNVINCPPGHTYGAFEMWGAPGDSVILTNNTIDSPGHFAPFGGIFSFNINNGLIANTTITGEGLAAIYLGTLVPIGDQAANWHLLENNVKDFNAVAFDGYGLELPLLGVSPGESRAPIWLGTGTSDCTVVGGPGYSEYVYDEGTNNEILERGK